jgi:hypothetical protein
LRLLLQLLLLHLLLLRRRRLRLQRLRLLYDTSIYTCANDTSTFAGAYSWAWA